MELSLILKILFALIIVIAGYAIARNIDIIKIILIYWKELILLLEQCRPHLTTYQQGLQKI